MLFMNLKREGIWDFQLLMKWRNRSYGISRSLLWEVVVGRLSYDDIRRLTCRGTKNRYLYPWNQKLPGWIMGDQLELRETPFPPASWQVAPGRPLWPGSPQDLPCRTQSPGASPSWDATGLMGTTPETC